MVVSGCMGSPLAEMGSGALVRSGRGEQTHAVGYAIKETCDKCQPFADERSTDAVGLGASKVVLPVLPWLQMRYGLSASSDLALSLAGSGVRADFRWGQTNGLGTWGYRIQASPQVSWQNRGAQPSFDGMALGLQLTGALTRVFSDVFEFWLGPLIKAERFWILQGSSAHPQGQGFWETSLGGFFGLSIGFRPLAFFVEYNVAVAWQPERGLRQWVMTPVCGVRLRY